jgi:hypothetical protein
MLTMLNKLIIVSIDRGGFDCKAKLQMCKLKRVPECNFLLREYEHRSYKVEDGVHTETP